MSFDVEIKKQINLFSAMPSKQEDRSLCEID